MSKSKKLPAMFATTPRTSRVTTGTRDCAECGALAYSHHEAWCRKIRDN
jgi:hypothetical protein